MKKLLPILLILLFTQSCYHIEKRKYRSGFYLSRHERDRVDSDDFPETKDVDFSTPENTDAITLKSIDNSDVTKLLPRVAPIESSVIEKTDTRQPEIKLQVKKKVRVTPKKEESEPGKNAVTAGIIMLSTGTVVMIFVSILVGAVIFIAGAIFLTIGLLKKNDKPKKEQNEDYVDVVYLKNGSVIRGLIVEQVINVSLKIQTKDGSIFFYKMDEIEKITKEKEI